MLICRIEGGQMWSGTFRELMRRHYGVEIGHYSYGIMPEKFPNGTRIENFCSIASGVRAFRRNHPAKFVSLHPFFFNSILGLIDHDAIEASMRRFEQTLDQVESLLTK